MRFVLGEPPLSVRCSWHVDSAINEQPGRSERVPRSRRRLAAVAGAAIVLAIVVLAVFAPPQVAPVHPPADPGRGVVGQAALPSRSTCAVTRPDPVFVPPSPFLAAPPAAYASSWYGTAHLWTMLARDGEVWEGWVAATPPVLPQKTFWWSADWRPGAEPEPAIAVVGRRLDGTGSFTYGPGTNASADFGTAMLVGIDIPSYGCWELTARYRDASLTYVAFVGP